MFEEKSISVDAAAKRLWELAGKYKVPLLASLLFGFAAHMFMLTNKLVNADEISALFSKGATVTSGRWALSWFQFAFPSYSMPWLYGLCSLIFIALAVCVTVSIFKIKSPVFQGLLAAVSVSSTVVTATLCYMFTAAPYFFALLLAVLAVYLVSGRGLLRLAVGSLCLALSLGFYQGYFPVAASFFIVLMLKALLAERESPAAVIKAGLRYLGGLVAALVVYGVITYFTMSGLESNTYGLGSMGILSGLKNCYSSFFGVLFSGYFALVYSKYSVIFHVLCLLCGAVCLPDLLKKREPAAIALAALLLALLPIAINCLYLAASVEVIHTLVMAGYVSIYVLTMILVESSGKLKQLISWVLALSMLLIAAMNVTYANKCYLKMHIQYENAYALYSTVADDIRKCEDWEPGCTYAVLSTKTSTIVPVFWGIDTTGLVSVGSDLVNIYTPGYFMLYYVGLNMAEADADTKEFIRWDKEFLDMPCFPEAGYVQRIGSCIVAKLA